LSRPDSQTGAFSVWSLWECVRQRNATAGHISTQNALVRQSIYTTTAPDKTRRPRLPVDRRRDAGQAGLAVRPPTRSDVVRHENVNTLWTAAYD